MLQQNKFRIFKLMLSGAKKKKKKKKLSGLGKLGFKKKKKFSAIFWPLQFRFVHYVICCCGYCSHCCYWRSLFLYWNQISLWSINENQNILLTGQIRTPTNTTLQHWITIISAFCYRPYYYYCCCCFFFFLFVQLYVNVQHLFSAS